MAAYAKDDGIKAIAITSTTPFGNEDIQDMFDKLTACDALKPAVALAAGILTLTLDDTRIMRAAIYSTGPSITLSTGGLDGAAYVLTAAGNANGVYTGTIGATASALVGKKVLIDGFTTGANNGSFVVTANNGSTTVTTSNLSSATESHAGTATLDSVTADTWTVAELLTLLPFIRAANRIIKQFTISAFTVTYA